MAISFIRIDDRIIHGQTVTRWANEYPCTGLIGVNDAAAGNKLLVSAFKGASSKKTFVWNKEHFKKNADKVLTSKRPVLPNHKELCGYGGIISRF